MSFCPHGTAWLPLDRYSWNLRFEYFSKICKKIQVSLKYVENNEYFTWRRMCINGCILLSSSYNGKCHRSCREDQNTHFVCNNFFLNRAFYEIMGKNIFKPDWVHIMHMHTTCWMTKATDTHSEYAILTAFWWKQWLREHASSLCLYLYVARLVEF